MNVIPGDLLRLALDGRFDVIVHGCNCQCAMGKGIALSIKQQFPEAYENACMLLMYGIHRHLNPRALGAMGVLEQSASPRFQAMVDGCRRLASARLAHVSLRRALKALPPFASKPLPRRTLIPSEPTLFTLRVLGDPVLLGPDGPVRGRAAYKRRIALLAILAAARGRPVGRERLLGLLWEEQPVESARHVLSETLYVLRKELGDEAVVAVGGDVALNPARVASDVAAFEQAVEEGRREDAVAAYGGPLLDGFYVADAAELFDSMEFSKTTLPESEITNTLKRPPPTGCSCTS